MLRVAPTITPQGDVLSPFLWSLVANKLLEKFKGIAPKLIAYADDIAILVRNRFLDTISSVMNTALKFIHQWVNRPHTLSGIDLMRS